jgi:hypothetical protein
LSRITLGLTALWCGVLAPVWAQETAGVAGQLRDRGTREPVSNAAVTLLGKPPLLRSDSAGRFSRTGLSPGTYVIQVRKLGYTPGSWIVEIAPNETLTVAIELDPEPVLLPEVAIVGQRKLELRGLAGFEIRRARGSGVFFSEAQILQREARLLSDILRSVNGVREVCRRGICRVRMARGECAPNFFVDGFPANNSTTLEMPVIGIIAVEIYRTTSETPPEFLRGATTCGSIVIWTRQGL